MKILSETMKKLVNWYQVCGFDGNFLVLAMSYTMAIKRAKRKFKCGMVHGVHKLP